jgi:hypothetical protein
VLFRSNGIGETSTLGMLSGFGGLAKDSTPLKYRFEYRTLSIQA